MGFIPFTYWGQGCNDLLPTSSLVFYYNANSSISYDINYTGSGVAISGSSPTTTVGIVNLANQGTNLGLVVNSSYDNTYYGINTLNAGRIDINIPLNLYESSTQGTVLVKGYMAPFLNSTGKYLLRNPSNSNEGIRAFGTVNVTTKGRFTFSRGVDDINGVPTASMYNTEGIGTIAITKQTGQTFATMFTSADNFSSSYTSSGTLINDFDFIFENLGYFQAIGYWDRRLSTAELISSSLAFNCNALPQGYNATTASSHSNLTRFYGGTGGTTAYYIAPNQNTITRVTVGYNEPYYACVSNSGSNRLIVGGEAATVTDLGPCPTASIYPKVDVLLVAGGGGGGDSADWCGGGGAGGFLTSSITLSGSTTYPIIVGNGGARNTNGQDSNAFSLTAIGGGAGGYGSGSFRTGSSGGSGGGAGYTNTTPFLVTGAPGTIGQGKNGGNSDRMGGGGGGAFENGYLGSSVGATIRRGYGGDGNYYYFTNTIYAGGGGGSFFRETSISFPPDVALLGGAGGGGMGAWSYKPSFDTPQVERTSSAGLPNTGGGGGAGYQYLNAFPVTSSLASPGGSGIVIISYSGSTPQATGGTITSGSGYVVHTFTSSANFVTL